MIIWIEAESFKDLGGWSTDTQFVDQMGSTYLLATGVGKPVSDAVTHINIPESGTYRIWVRTKDWFPSHSPGKFQVYLNKNPSPTIFGESNDAEWKWIDGGKFDLEKGNIEIRLHDLTGWWGRCDSIILENEVEFTPSNELKELKKQRYQYHTPEQKGVIKEKYDVVVLGGGAAGCAAAIAAAKNGAKVCLVHDRPVLGGNASDEIKVPPMGYTGTPVDKIGVTGITEELFPFEQRGYKNHASSSHLESLIINEPNISLYLHTRAIDVEMKTKDIIKSIIAVNITNQQYYQFEGDVFIDCTGHAWLGYHSKALFMIGEEAKDQFNEFMAPEKATLRTMGNNLYDSKIVENDKESEFKSPDWAYLWKSPDDFDPIFSNIWDKWDGGQSRCEILKRSKEFDNGLRGRGKNIANAGYFLKNRYGGVFRHFRLELGGGASDDIIEDAEHIRDELFRIVLGLWNYVKNYDPKFKKINKNSELVHLNHIMGVRESRRLVGDFILSQRDYDEMIIHPDTIAFSDWGPDIHHPEGFWSKGYDVMHFYRGRRVSIPFRTLYSKNISNLMMAGRCHSATHIAMAGTRIIRSVAMMGEAAGTGAALAIRYRSTPREIYQKHIKELQQILLKSGCYLLGVKNEDSKDLALKAQISASSESKHHKASNINNGWNRNVGKNSNAWITKDNFISRIIPSFKKPHWTVLDFKEKALINEIHITFKDQNNDINLQSWESGQWKNVDIKSIKKIMKRKIITISEIQSDKLKISYQGSKVGVFEVRVYR